MESGEIGILHRSTGFHSWSTVIQNSMCNLRNNVKQLIKVACANYLNDHSEVT